jgi:hypothetical protein
VAGDAAPGQRRAPRRMYHRGLRLTAARTPRAGESENRGRHPLKAAPVEEMRKRS